MVRGFSLIELLIVLSLYSLILLVVFPIVRNRTISDKDTLQSVINKNRLKAFNIKQDIILVGEKGKLKTSLGETYEIPQLTKGFCIIKSSGIPMNCEFYLTKNVYVFSVFGFKKFTLNDSK